MGHMISRFLFSKGSGILALVLIPVLVAAGAGIIHLIGDRAVVKEQLKAERFARHEAQRRVTAEIAISKHKEILDKEVRHAPDHDGCDNPAILTDGLIRLHVGRVGDLDRQTGEELAGLPGYKIPEREIMFYINEARAAYESCRAALNTEN